jgi:hypothetical protein
MSDRHAKGRVAGGVTGVRGGMGAHYRLRRVGGSRAHGVGENLVVQCMSLYDLSVHLPLHRAGKLKGLARAGRAAGARATRGGPLDREAEALLIATATVLSEGAAVHGADGSETYFGSTMLTVALAPLEAAWGVTLDADARALLLARAGRTPSLHLRAMRLARREAAQRVAGRALGTTRVELRFSLREAALCIDVDLEAPLGVGSLRRSQP